MFGFFFELTLVHCFNKALRGKHVETLAGLNGVSLDFMGVFLCELQLAPEGAVAFQTGELQHCIFETMV